MIALAHKEKTVILKVNLVFRRDPTRTLGIQSRFVRDVNARFQRLKGDIRRSIVDNDCFGLTDRLFLVGVAARPRQFAFARSSDKVKSFMDWLNVQEEMGILEVVTRPGRAISIEEAWTDKYIQSAYQQAMVQARANMRRRGVDIPSFEQIPGGAASAMFNQPIHADRLGLLYTRTFNELKGIDDAMDQAISRVLTQGMAEGRSPRQLARIINNRVDNIGRTRSRMLARTEIVRAHAEATLTEMELARIEGVSADVEFSSAGFNTCPQCSFLIGRVYTIQEARGIIPVHPHCRCAWTSANVGEDRKEARRLAREQKEENVKWWEKELEKEEGKRRPDRSKIGRIRRTIGQLRETL